MSKRFFTPQTIEQHLGETFSSAWFLMDQRRITAFGGITEDFDPHHIDPAFAAKNSLHGKTIAFGFLTLSMLTAMLYEVLHYALDGDASEGWPVNFGFRELRFVAPVLVDSRIRGHFTVKEVSERKPGQKLFVLDCTVEIEGQTKPAMIALWECVWVSAEGSP